MDIGQLKETCEKAVEVYGFNAQILMVFEEMFELGLSICKTIRHSNEKSNDAEKYIKKHDKLIDNIAEEIADNIIMKEQLVYIYDLKDQVEEYIDKKVSRLKSRLSKHT